MVVGHLGIVVMACLCDMQVRSLQKPFGSVKKEEGLSWLGVMCAKDVSETWIAPVLNLGDRLTESVSKVTGWTTVKVNFRIL